MDKYVVVESAVEHRTGPIGRQAIPIFGAGLTRSVRMRQEAQLRAVDRKSTRLNSSH